MQIAINPTLYGTAQVYAEKRGLNLSKLIEDFLRIFVRNQEQATEQPVPDIVLSLLGAGQQTSADDLNGHEAYYQYLEEKYK